MPSLQIDRFGAARDHHVGVAALDLPEATRRCVCALEAQAVTLQRFGPCRLSRMLKLARGHVRNDLRNEERRDPVDSPWRGIRCELLRSREVRPCRRRCSRPCVRAKLASGTVEAGVAVGFETGSQREVHVTADTPGFLELAAWVTVCIRARDGTDRPARVTSKPFTSAAIVTGQSSSQRA